jgi:hypothetical protein
MNVSLPGRAARPDEDVAFLGLHNLAEVEGIG